MIPTHKALRHMTLMCSLIAFGCSGGALAQIPPRGGGAPSEKAQRSVVAQRIDSQLLYAMYERRGESEARGTPTETAVVVDPDGRTMIDVRAEVTPELEEEVRRLGGTIVSASRAHRSVLARFPLDGLEDLASLPAVRFVAPAASAATH